VKIPSQKHNDVTQPIKVKELEAWFCQIQSHIVLCVQPKNHYKYSKNNYLVTLLKVPNILVQAQPILLWLPTL